MVVAGIPWGLQRNPFYTYQLGNLIGRGNIGSVFQGLGLMTGEIYAVKVISLKGHHLSQNLIYEKFERAKNIFIQYSEMDHPHLTKYHDFCLDQENSQIEIISEYVPGGAITELHRKNGNKPEEYLILKHTKQILDALKYLHDRNKIHRFLSGSKVLLTSQGNVKVSDYFLNELLEIFGIPPSFFPHWSAPELLLHQTVEKSCDVWSLGCVIMEIITGQPPWKTTATSYEEHLGLLRAECKALLCLVLGILTLFLCYV